MRSPVTRGPAALNATGGPRSLDGRRGLLAGLEVDEPHAHASEGERSARVACRPSEQVADVADLGDGGHLAAVRGEGDTDLRSDRLRRAGLDEHPAWRDVPRDPHPDAAHAIQIHGEDLVEPGAFAPVKPGMVLARLRVPAVPEHRASLERCRA